MTSCEGNKVVNNINGLAGPRVLLHGFSTARPAVSVRPRVGLGSCGRSVDAMRALSAQGWLRRRAPRAGLQESNHEKKVIWELIACSVNCRQWAGERSVAAREASAVAQTKQASKRSRQKAALPLMGAAGATLVLGGASATPLTLSSAAVVPSQDQAPSHEVILGEEEIADVSLATFYVFDREADKALQDNLVLAARCGGCGGRCGGIGRCGRCGGCAVARCGRCGCAGCRRCGVGWGVWGCGGCSCSCCVSWGRCTWVC